jgi:hypothetical protein
MAYPARQNPPELYRNTRLTPLVVILYVLAAHNCNAAAVGGYPGAVAASIPNIHRESALVRWSGNRIG